MADDNLIATLYASPENRFHARNIIRYNLKNPRWENKVLSSTSEPGLRLTFDRIRNWRQGFRVGRNPGCDITISIGGAGSHQGISDFHCTFGFDDRDRFIVTDERASDGVGQGMSVMYGKKGGERRRGHRWILSGEDFADDCGNVVVCLTEKVHFLVVVPRRKEGCPVFRDNVDRFREGLMVQPMHEALVGLSFKETDVTGVASLVQAAGTGRIFCVEEKILGSGSYGKVRRAADVSSGVVYAVKKPSSHTRSDMWEREIRILRGTNHPHIVQLECVVRYPNDEPPPELYLELAPLGSLSYQDEKKRITRPETVSVLHQALSALQYLHARKPPIIHGDMKPANLLVFGRSDSHLHIKICDFGGSFDGGSEHTFCGTKFYFAPEVVGIGTRREAEPTNMDTECETECEEYTSAVDIWSLGIIALKFAVGFPTFPNAHQWVDAVVAKVARETKKCEIAKFLARHMLLKDAENRSSADECLKAAPASIDGLPTPMPHPEHFDAAVGIPKPAPEPAPKRASPPPSLDSDRTIRPRDYYSAAEQAYAKAFPNGACKIPTDGQGLLCGLRSIIHSIRRQHADIERPPTLSELQEVFSSDAVQQANDELLSAKAVNTNNFSVDQLGAVIYHWGLQFGHHLQIGYGLANGKHYLVGTQSDKEPTNRIIWILSDSKTGVSDNCMNHFSGLAPREPDSSDKGGDRQRSRPSPDPARKAKRPRGDEPSSDEPERKRHAPQCDPKKLVDAAVKDSEDHARENDCLKAELRFGSSLADCGRERSLPSLFQSDYEDSSASQGETLVAAQHPVSEGASAPSAAIPLETPDGPNREGQAEDPERCGSTFLLQSLAAGDDRGQDDGEVAQDGQN